MSLEINSASDCTVARQWAGRRTLPSHEGIELVAPRFGGQARRGCGCRSARGRWAAGRGPVWGVLERDAALRRGPLEWRGRRRQEEETGGLIGRTRIGHQVNVIWAVITGVALGERAEGIRCGSFWGGLGGLWWTVGPGWGDLTGRGFSRRTE